MVPICVIGIIEPLTVKMEVGCEGKNFEQKMSELEVIWLQHLESMSHKDVPVVAEKALSKG